MDSILNLRYMWFYFIAASFSASLFSLYYVSPCRHQNHTDDWKLVEFEAHVGTREFMSKIVSN